MTKFLESSNSRFLITFKNFLKFSKKLSKSHENAQLKKKIAKLEEKLILAEVKDKEKSAQIKDFETQIKVLNKQLAEKRGYKIRDEK